MSAEETVKITIRCTKEEHEKITLQAAETHRSVSEFMVHATMEYIKARQGNENPFVHNGRDLT